MLHTQYGGSCDQTSLQNNWLALVFLFLWNDLRLDSRLKDITIQARASLQVQAGQSQASQANPPTSWERPPYVDVQDIERSPRRPLLHDPRAAQLSGPQAASHAMASSKAGFIKTKRALRIGGRVYKGAPPFRPSLCPSASWDVSPTSWIQLDSLVSLFEDPSVPKRGFGVN